MSTSEDDLDDELRQKLDNVLPLKVKPKPNGGGPNGDAETGKPAAYKLLADLKLSTKPYWLIEDVLPRAMQAMIYGPGGSGKTYIGVSIAIGFLLAKWFGKTAEKGAVMICAFERHDDSEDRLAALRDKHTLEGPLALVDMTGQGLVGEAEASIIAAAKEIATISGQPVRAILMDTVSAALCGQDEDATALGLLRAAGERIARATGAMVIWIHHEGKADHNGPRGHLQLAEGCSVWWRVEEHEDGSRVVHVDKANRGPVHAPIAAFRLVPFTAGRDEKGKDIVLCDVESVDLGGALASPVRVRFGPKKGDKPGEPSGTKQKLLMGELVKLAAKHPNGPDDELLQSAFIAKLATEMEGAGKKLSEAWRFKQTFRQTLGPMIDKGLVERTPTNTLLPCRPA